MITQKVDTVINFYDKMFFYERFLALRKITIFIFGLDTPARWPPGARFNLFFADTYQKNDPLS